jgi:hypothetical protein
VLKVGQLALELADVADVVVSRHEELRVGLATIRLGLIKNLERVEQSCCLRRHLKTATNARIDQKTVGKKEDAMVAQTHKERCAALIRARVGTAS